MSDTSPSRHRVECLKLGKTYPPDITALREVSLTAAAGELLFITGPSGAGKSTLLKLIDRREVPDQGVVMFNGHDPARASGPQLQARRRRIGVAYQDFKLLPRLSAAANVALALEVAYRRRDFIEHRLQELFSQLELTGKEQRPAGELSLGEQQRLTIARAAANQPELLLADEPTGNLDAASGQLVLQLFKQLSATGTTIIAATHDERLYGSGEYRILRLDAGTLTEV